MLREGHVAGKAKVCEEEIWEKEKGKLSEGGEQIVCRVQEIGEGGWQNCNPSKPGEMKQNA